MMIPIIPSSTLEIKAGCHFWLQNKFRTSLGNMRKTLFFPKRSWTWWLILSSSTWEAEAELPWVWGQPLICSKLNASLDNMVRPCFKKKLRMAGRLAQIFNSSTLEAEQVNICEIKASLVCITNSRPTGAKGRPCILSTLPKKISDIKKFRKEISKIS